MTAPRIWIRHESRDSERRAPVVPDDARRLVEAGVAVTVEDSPQRSFGSDAYAAAGCAIAPAGSWVDAPDDWYVVGLKELPEQPPALRHRHVFFGHAYKGQVGAAELLRRFGDGGGALLDLEYLVDDAGRRLAAFGYWAGYVGAALAVLRDRGALPSRLEPLSRPELDGRLARAGATDTTALVLGSLGRCGRGARDAFAVAGITATGWDLAETRDLDRAALLDHHLLVNAVQVSTPGPVFVRPQDLDDPVRQLRVIADVTCDVTSDCNVLPIYDTVTSWDAPVRQLRGGDRPLGLIAIDNLPSLLPREASIAFSAELTPQLATLGTDAPAWRRCRTTFDTALAGASRTRGEP
ncbi:MAG: saccharopine dehydrogenase [Micromonosporaceae bacterium]